LKLAKVDGINWPSLLSSGETQIAGPSSHVPLPASIPEEKPKPKRKNWDTVVVDEDEERDSKDPVRNHLSLVSCLSRHIVP
jgi:hypothetical protein